MRKKDDPMQNDVQKAHVFVDNCSSKSCFKRSPCTRRSCRTWWANNKQSTDVKRALSILLVYLSGRPPRIQMFTFDRRQFLRLKMQERLNVVQSLLRWDYDCSCTDHGTFFLSLTEPCYLSVNPALVYQFNTNSEDDNYRTRLKRGYSFPKRKMNVRLVPKQCKAIDSLWFCK